MACTGHPERWPGDTCPLSPELLDAVGFQRPQSNCSPTPPACLHLAVIHWALLTNLTHTGVGWVTSALLLTEKKQTHSLPQRCLKGAPGKVDEQVGRCVPWRVAHTRSSVSGRLSPGPLFPHQCPGPQLDSSSKTQAKGISDCAFYLSPVGISTTLCMGAQRRLALP